MEYNMGNNTLEFRHPSAVFVASSAAKLWTDVHDGRLEGIVDASGDRLTDVPDVFTINGDAVRFSTDHLPQVWKMLDMWSRIRLGQWAEVTSLWELFMHVKPPKQYTFHDALTAIRVQWTDLNKGWPPQRNASMSIASADLPTRVAYHLNRITGHNPQFGAPTFVVDPPVAVTELSDTGAVLASWTVSSPRVPYRDRW
jgi:hypothetical protein